MSADSVCASTPTPRPQRLGPVFLMVWGGEWVIVFASSLLSFALGVWAYQSTGSVQQFSLMIVAGTVPALLLMPFAGALADRWPRRRLILGCDLAFLATALLLVLLQWHQGLSVEMLYPLNVMAATVTALRLPASRAVVAAVVPQALLARANGMQGLSLTASQLGSPLLAGALMDDGSALGGVLALVTGLSALGMGLVFAALTRAGTTADARADQALHGSNALRGVYSALAYFARQADMRRLLAYTSIQKGLLTLVASMMTPLVLSTEPARVLGVVMTAAAAGGLMGSLSLAVVNPRRGLVTVVLVLDAALSLFVVAAGSSVSPLWWGVCGFLAAWVGSMSEGCAGTVWMRQAPPGQQAAVLALVSMCGMASVSLVLLGGAALSAQVLEPAMAVGGAWAGTLGTWLGTGPGRGIGLLFVGCGSICLMIALGALAQGGLRRTAHA